MTITIILNGISRKKKKFYAEIYPHLHKHFALDVHETQHATHAEELAAEAVTQKTSVIIAAGGDGTLHQVINGALKNIAAELPPIGVIPLGSGNDFARTCSIRPDATQLVQLIKSGSKLTDIGHVTCLDFEGKTITRQFLNVCSVGLGPAVVMNMAKKRAWEPDLAYITSIVSTFFSHRPQEVSCSTPSWEWKGKARVVAIANGKTYGNGIYIAPDAQQDDGLFNSFIAGELPLWKFLLYLQNIKGKKKITDSMIHYNSTARVSLHSDDMCPLEADGELVGQLPAEIIIQPGRVRFLR